MMCHFALYICTRNSNSQALVGFAKALFFGHMFFFHVVIQPGNQVTHLLLTHLLHQVTGENSLERRSPEIIIDERGFLRDIMGI